MGHLAIANHMAEHSELDKIWMVITPHNPFKKKSVESYYRQYIPYINKHNQRIIEINAFCEILKNPPNPENGISEWTKMDWRKEYVMVNDGGACYWKITINIDTMEFKDLMVNGHA